MQLTEFGMRLILLFFPGVICTLAVNALASYRPHNTFLFAVRSLVYGVSSYAILGLFYAVWATVFHGAGGLAFFLALTNPDVPIAVEEIGYATAVGLALSILTSWISTRKLQYKLARALRITRKFGNEDVWDYLLNSPTVTWLTVRDHKRNLVYDGWVSHFSEGGHTREIYIQDVIVYRNDTGQRLYSAAGVYIASDPSDLTIEFQLAQERDSQEHREEGNANQGDP